MVFETYEQKTRSITRNLIAEVEPENVDAVVDSITGDMNIGALISIEVILANIDDSMGYYEIRELLLDFKVKVDLTQIGF